MGNMRVLFATAEFAPVVAVGGLAQAAAGLTHELRRHDVEVEVVLPDYDQAALSDRLVDATVTALTVPAWAGEITVHRGFHPEIGRVSLVASAALRRTHPYVRPDGTGWSDNDLRFFSFARAVAALVEHDAAGGHPDGARFDVVHLNDWHTAPALAALAPTVPTVLSLHNLAFQGTADGRWLTAIGERARHYEWYGGVNALSGGIALADAVVAVSPTHADEIRTPLGGFGLDEALRHRGGAVTGILNGIDTSVWNPADDPVLAQRYSVDSTDAERAAARAANRVELFERLGEPEPDDGRLLAVMVTRLTGQKGADIAASIVPVLGDIPMRLVVLGSGEVQLAADLHAAAAAHPDDFRFVEGYDDDLAHLLFAAADVFLMPSRFEPCGLAQMQAMRYGTVPVVTATGGLRDTVVDIDRARSGTGFVAPHATGSAVTAALFRAHRRLAAGRGRQAVIRRIMKIDWSWRLPAAQYRAVYDRVVEHHARAETHAAPPPDRGGQRASVSADG